MHPRHQRRLPRAGHAGRERQRVVLQRDRRTCGLSDADGRAWSESSSDETDGCEIAFPEAGLDIVLIGETRDELGGSEWQQMRMPDALALPPRVDLDREKALVEFLLAAHNHRLLRSAHDLANGGLAVALAECAMERAGCHVELGGHADDVDAIALLFGESQARAIVSTAKSDEVLRLAKHHGVAAMRIGRTEVATFIIERNGVPLIRTTTPELARIWRSAFALLLGGDSIDDVIRGVGEEAELIAHGRLSGLHLLSLEHRKTRQRRLLPLVVDAIEGEAHAPVRALAETPGDGDDVIVRKGDRVLHDCSFVRRSDRRVWLPSRAAAERFPHPARMFCAFSRGRSYIHRMGLQTTPHFDASIHPTAVEVPACLVVLYGGELGRRTELPQYGVTIGRDDDNAISVALHTMSRRHARLFVADGLHHIEDLGSTNGTFVNEQELTGPTPLRNGDLVRCGGAVFKFIDGGNVEALYHEEIYRLTITDGLTQVANKRHFCDFLEREIVRAARHGRPLSLVFFDVDHFKLLNDEFGHLPHSTTTTSPST